MFDTTDLIEDGQVLTLQDSGFMGETWRRDELTGNHGNTGVSTDIKTKLKGCYGQTIETN